MLGAQALRTKQKAEQKEKEKRHRERIRSMELQREKIQRAACEEQAAAAAAGAVAPPSSQLFLEMPREGREIPRHRHSVHSSSALHSQHVSNSPARSREASANGQFTNGLLLPQRSPSSDYCRQDRHRDSQSGGSRLMRWLGFGSSSNEKDEKRAQRRMSTY